MEREVYLKALDMLWMQHLENMQHLREGIHWRSVGQRDPLVEYRSESQKLFDGLQRNLREEVLKILLSVSKQDVASLAKDDEYDSELTKMAAGATEKGVNEVSAGQKLSDEDFKKGGDSKVAAGGGAKSSAAKSKKKTDIKKSRKKARQNKKRGRK
jgi:preprotein translocase subunit SecA